MKTYIVQSWTNYGEAVSLINADSEGEARGYADSSEYVWEGYRIKELETTVRGIVFTGGGDNG